MTKTLVANTNLAFMAPNSVKINLADVPAYPVDYPLDLTNNITNRFLGNIGNGLGGINLQAGKNITFDTQYNTLTINSLGGGGGTGDICPTTYVFSEYTNIGTYPNAGNVYLPWGNPFESSNPAYPGGNNYVYFASLHKPLSSVGFVAPFDSLITLNQNLYWNWNGPVGNTDQIFIECKTDYSLDNGLNWIDGATPSAGVVALSSNFLSDPTVTWTGAYTGGAVVRNAGGTSAGTAAFKVKAGVAVKFRTKYRFQKIIDINLNITNMVGYGSTTVNIERAELGNLVNLSNCPCLSSTNPIDSVPVGTIINFADSTAPLGYLECDGRSLNKSIFVDLFNVIGYTYGGGGTSFNLPDLRSQFVRGWDHGANIDTGRAFGSKQDDAFKSHTHNLANGNSPIAIALYSGGNSPNGKAFQYYDTGETPIIATGGTETRPKNIALLPCIKYATTAALNTLGLSAQNLLNIVNSVLPVIPAPIWYVGQSNKLLYEEVGTNRISKQISNSEQYTAHLVAIVQKNRSTPRLPRGLSVTDSRIGAGYGEGTVNLGDGRIFCMGSYANAPHIYDSNTDSFRVVPGNGDQESGGATLMADGRVMVNATTAGKAPQMFDPVTETWSTAAATSTLWGGGFFSYNAALLPDGKVYFNPSETNVKALIYDPVTNIVIQSNNAPVGHSHTCCSLRDGRVFRIPGTSAGGAIGTLGYIYNPTTNNFDEAPGRFPATAGGWFGGRLTAEGKLVMAPNNNSSTGAAIFDPVAGTITTTGVLDWHNALPGNVLNYSGGVLLQDGRLFFPPWCASKAIIYDPYLNTTLPVPSIASPTGDTGYGGCNLTVDGNVFALGYAQPSRILRIQHVQNFDLNTISSPFFSHGSY
jgi:microcystin-dependent protein